MLPTACLKSQLGCCGGSDPCSVAISLTSGHWGAFCWGVWLDMRYRPATNIPLVSVNLSCLGKTRKQMHGNFGKLERTYNCICIVHVYVNGSVFVDLFSSWKLKAGLSLRFCSRLLPLYGGQASLSWQQFSTLDSCVATEGRSCYWTLQQFVLPSELF